MAMVNGITTSDRSGLDNGRGSKSHVGSRIWQETPDEAQRTYQPKRCENSNNDEDNRTKTVNDKNDQDSSEKFIQPILLSLFILIFVYIRGKIQMNKCDTVNIKQGNYCNLIEK